MKPKSTSPVPSRSFTSWYVCLCTTSMLRPILSDASIFAVDLYEAGLADKVAGYWQELMAGPGAVRATVKKYVDT